MSKKKEEEEKPPSSPQAYGLTGGRTSPGIPRGHQIHKTFNNLKITILCGFLTILVLRGNIGVGNLGGTDAEAENQNLIEETNRDPISQMSSPRPTLHTLSDPRSRIGMKSERSGLKRNPEFPNYAYEKARILLVIPDNPIGDHYILKAIKNKIDYFRIHGIEMVYNMAHLDKELSGYWANYR
ncbi:hypothetical protein HHK36_015396 [Tetracentron sinense]|uniref:Uncharacterized protein n=1 Tax=Tetracentron sinense TaxID=13715 RepID=A0A835DGQ7_TETSI|nr:hypothetical protein HHK36_015396 [Tetracentron sinense]